ncbi:MAG TPA: ribosome silencing factor [Actinomycetota bacterium]|nr:ribosome silencing factor [Actinomycetota bacterium]
MTTQRGTGSGGDLAASADVAIAAARAAADKQAEDIVILDVHDLIVITDYFVICSAGTSRQVRTVIEAIEERLRNTTGSRPARREGEDGAGWWLLDYIDIVVHVFGTEERGYYDLERLWSDAPRLRWEVGSRAVSGG